MESGPIADIMDFGRMYDQYMHKGNQNFDLSLSVPNSNSHISYMADQTNSYASFENSNNNNGRPTATPVETYTDMSNMTPHENSHSHTPVTTHMMQPSHPHQQPVYQQLGVSSMHDGNNVQFPPQNLYIPSISQHGLVPQSSGFMGPRMDHSNLVYTNAGHGMHGQPPLGHMMGSNMMPNPFFPRPQMIRSGSSPNSGGSPSPGSEDSDDSNTQAQITGMKRPSPEIVADAVMAPNKGKKARVSKKSKKKKDPNEPQKPVSAYALFFRDTQASIKGQNPNASFGEVSKIVASMWDSLDSEQKNAYKRKTEAAKKEYLKKLAAYRATLVSKGEGEPNVYPGSQPYGQMQPGANYGYSVTTSTGPHHVQGHSPPQLSPLAKKSPMLTPMMTESQMNPPMSQPMPPSNPSMMGPMSGMASMGQTQIPSQPPHQTMVQGPHLSQLTPVPPSSPYMTQANPALSSPVSSMGSDVGSPVGHSVHNPQTNQQSQQHSPPQSHLPMTSGSNQNSGTHNGQQLQGQNTSQMCNTGACLRSGCNNPAVNNPEWEEEYCSNECVVSHCRDVFGNWVSTNQQNAPIYPAPVK